MQQHYQFKCPECGADTAEEILVDAIVVSEFLTVEIDNDKGVETAVPEYGKQTNDDGAVIGYRCRKCGHRLPDVMTTYDLAAWFKEHGVLRQETQ